MKDLSIIIVNWNTGSFLRNCIESIYNQTTKYSFEIIVVDNDSKDHSELFIVSDYPKIKLIKNKINLGFAAANNQAIKQVDSDYILLLNPDTEVIGYAIDKMLDYIKSSDYQLLTCKLLNSDLSLQPSVYKFSSPFQEFFDKKRKQIKLVLTRIWRPRLLIKLDFDYNKDSEIDWARGAVLMFSKEACHSIGLLDEQFFIYGEEIDYYFRAREKGYKSGYISNITIIHKGQVSSNQVKNEMYIQGIKSKYIFIKKHYSYIQYLFYRFNITVFNIFKYLISIVEFDKKQINYYKKIIMWHFSNSIKITKIKNSLNKQQQYIGK